ncbi:MAG: oxidoreductase [Anaerolineales bacterium]
MNRKSLFFTAPGQVSVREEPLQTPGPGQVTVRTLLTAISSGTETLLYRGLFPNDLVLDDNIDALTGAVEYPLKYGYSAVGEVIDLGHGVSPEWMGRRVFAFQPHMSHFVADLISLQVIPDGLSVEDAVFLPNMETAVNFIMDGAPTIGEQVVVLGQGLVGLLTTALLSQHPLASLVTLDRYSLRRQASLRCGALVSLDPNDAQALETILPEPPLEGGHRGADLVFELTGDPGALNQAISMCGFNGRVVVGSWYGKKRAEVDLGGWFHRSRMNLISSQVSSINPKYTARWDKSRRFQVAWEMLQIGKPSHLITHTFPIQGAVEAYQLLAENPGETIQVVFTY